MPKELIHLGRPPRDGEFQLWVGWQRDMDVQVGIGIPEDTAEGMRSISLIEQIYGGSRTDLQQIGQWLAQFARSAEQADMGTAVGDAQTGGWAYDDERLERNAAALLRFLGTLQQPHGSTVWWHPSRYAINGLIRSLRKARDAAFGRDE